MEYKTKNDQTHIDPPLIEHGWAIFSPLPIDRRQALNAPSEELLASARSAVPCESLEAPGSSARNFGSFRGLVGGGQGAPVVFPRAKRILSIYGMVKGHPQGCLYFPFSWVVNTWGYC